MGDPYDLRRFVVAQQDVYDAALSELRAGRKTSHWMWFIFPQIAGLGRSATAQKYAIASLAEAESYLAHPLLGPRLLECARVLTELRGRTARADLRRGRRAETPVVNDAVRTRRGENHRRSSEVLAQYFDGAEDRATLQRL